MAGFLRPKPEYDFVILGAGHAGLQAGLKVGLLNHTALLLDRGPKYSRSYYAPAMDNIPGFPDGISGHKLLDLQIAQVRRMARFTDYLTPVNLESVHREGAHFVTRFERLKARYSVRSRVLLLALGVVDRIPEVGGKIDAIFPWANFGIVDFCMICDGHTLPGRSIAVIGWEPLAVRTAVDLGHWGPSSVTLLTHGHPLLAESPTAEREELLLELERHHIPVRESAIVGFDGIKDKRLGVQFEDGHHEVFDKGFSALPWYSTHAEIARQLGARITPDGYVDSDEDGRVRSASDGSILPGLYVAGDQRDGWKQIPEAWASAERAVIHAWGFYLSEGGSPPDGPGPSPPP